MATSDVSRQRPIGRRFVTRLSAAAITAVLGVVVMAGAALAYWTSTGSGSGSASTGTVTLSASVTGVSGLYPGASVPASVVLTNTSASSSLTIQSVTAGTTTISTAGKGICTASAVTFTPTTTLPSSAIAPGSPFTVNGNVTMTTGADDGCQAAIFSIPLTATGQTS